MRDIELKKNSKLAELKELTDILEGTNLFEELNDLNAMTNRHEKTSAPTGRKTKVDEIEYMIMDAEKALNHSRDRLASSMLLASDMKSGVLHLLRLLKMDKVRNTLLAGSSFDSSNNGDILNSYGRRGDRASAIFSALNSIEERLGQMVDVLDIVKQSRSQSLARRSSSNKVSPSSKKKRKRKAKSNKNYWDPSKDPHLKPTESNVRPVGTPVAGPDGIVAPRRPVSRIVAMRRDSFDKYGSHMASNIAGNENIMKKKSIEEGGGKGDEALEPQKLDEEDFDLLGITDEDEDEEGWFKRTQVQARRVRIKEERKRTMEKEKAMRDEQRKREQKEMEARMQYEAALKAKQNLILERQEKAAKKRERLLKQQMKYSEEAAEKKRQRMQKKSLRRPLWKKKSTRKKK